MRQLKKICRWGQLILAGVAIAVGVIVTVGCEGSDSEADGNSETLSGKLVIFHAGSLAAPFGELAGKFMEKHPDVRVLREVAGSRECARKVCDLGKRCDLLASADSAVIANLLMGSYADWYIEFATNEMVVVCRDSLHEGLTVENLPDRLLQSKAIGRADPDLDPCGYRTLMVWQLLERYYKRKGLYRELLEICPASKTRPKETDLLALLECGQLDYFFIYRSVAEQHGLNYLVLPDEVNLSQASRAALYDKAVVSVSGKKPGSTMVHRGKPIVYGVTVPSNAEHAESGKAFVRFLLSQEGKAIMRANGHGQAEKVFPEGSTEAQALLCTGRQSQKEGM